MSGFEGRFCWVELMAADREAAKAFYGTVVGWGWEAAPPPNAGYTLFTHAGRPAAGLMEQPEPRRRLGLPPAWLGHVAVADVDASAALAESLGATIRVPGTDIPEVGRFAVITDPQGAALGLFHPDPIPDHAPPAGDQPGGIRWRELSTPDWPAAFAFYHRLFSWEKGEVFQMGETGDSCAYQLLTIGGEPFGGMYGRPGAAASWLFYFGVPDIDEAASRAAAAGARVATGPTEVPGGGWIIQAADPEGAAFALHGGRKA